MLDFATNENFMWLELNNRWLA